MLNFELHCFTAYGKFFVPDSTLCVLKMIFKNDLELEQCASIV